MEFSSLNEVASERQDVTVLGIMSYGSRDEAIQTQRNLALTFSLVSDPDGKIYDALRAPATPWKVIIDVPTSQIIYEDRPDITPAETQAFLDRIAELPPR